MSLKRYFGDKEFYFKTAKIAIPLALQQMLTSAQSIVDTVMVELVCFRLNFMVQMMNII